MKQRRTRDSIAADVEAYLAKGGKVEQVRAGLTAKDFDGAVKLQTNDIRNKDVADILSAEFDMRISAEHVAMCRGDGKADRIQGSGLTPRMAGIICSYLQSVNVPQRKWAKARAAGWAG